MSGALAQAGDEWALLSAPTVAVVAVPWLLGALALLALGVRRRDDALAWGGWAWGLGVLLVGLSLFAWLAAGGPVRAVGWVPPAVLLPLGALAWRARRRARGASSPSSSTPAASACVVPPPGTLVGRLALGAALALVLVLAGDRIVRSHAWLVSIADEAVIWAAKAKVLWEAGGLGGHAADPAWTSMRVMHADYPLLNPLLQLWVYGLAGGIVHAVNRLPLELVVPALALAAAGGLRVRARPALAAVLLLLLLTAQPVPELSSRALSDGLVALAFAMAVDAFERFRTTGCPRWWRLLVAALALLAWSKNEGLMLALAFAVPAALSLRRGAAASAARRPSPRELLLLALPVLLAAAQWSVNAAQRNANDLVEGGLLGEAWPAVLADLPARATVVGRHLAERILLPSAGAHLLLALFLGLALLHPRRLLRRHEPVTAAAVLLGLAGYALVYLATPRELDWHLKTSLERVLFHVTPAATLWSAGALERLLGDLARER